MPATSPFPSKVTRCHLNGCHHRGARLGAALWCWRGETSGAALPEVWVQWQQMVYRLISTYSGGIMVTLEIVIQWDRCFSCTIFGSIAHLSLWWVIWICLHQPLSFRDGERLLLRAVCFQELVLSFLKVVIKWDHIIMCHNVIAKWDFISSYDFWRETFGAGLGDMGSAWYSKKFFGCYFTQFVLLACLSLHIYIPSIHNKCFFSTSLS